MSAASKTNAGRSREWRRAVVIPARLRSGTQWSDACILNISSRGLLIHSGRAGPAGSLVELHRGDQVIIARVVWKHGAKAGLQSDEKLPVEQIMAATVRGNLRLVAAEGAIVERRARSRLDTTEAREFGRKLEYVVGCVLALGFAVLIARSAFETMARPFEEAGNALIAN